MNPIQGIEPVTTLKSKAAELIRSIRRTRQPVVITQNGKPTAVLQDIESFQQQRETLLLLMAISQGERDYREGRFTSGASVNRHFGRVLARLTRR